jgi:hypothetical protein
MNSPTVLPLPSGEGRGEGARWPPLDPQFVVARGEAGRALARGLLATPERLTKLRGLVSGDLLALTGPDLPWVDGAEYFGRDGDSSWLLIPTHQVLEAPTSWLERRYRAAFPQAEWPCLLMRVAPLPDPLPASAGRGRALLPVGRAAALHPPLLEQWIAR